LNFFFQIFKLLPPEIAHSISLNSLNILYKLNLLKFISVKTSTKHIFNFEGMVFKNRLGTAAGLDKNGDFIDSLGGLGFGFLEVGTVTPLPQYGNSKPRVFRNYGEDSIINRLGFNNKGVDYLVENLKKRKFEGIVGVNIGANKSSRGDQRIEDYLICLEKVHQFADYITVNISSPNTPNLRELHSKNYLTNLLDSIEKKAKSLDIKKSLFLKISPDESNQTIDSIVELVNNSIFSGLIATNTTVDKSDLGNKKFTKIDGGLSGKPLLLKSTNKLSYIRSKSKNIPLIGVGGVMNDQDFKAKLQAGADLVQIYTGFVIKGPKLLNQILRD
jgi:dihydroorotate dehydrogenase